MNGQELNEMWQVEVNGQTYEAAFSELPDWIAEGSLLPEDKVRKGNLRWIEARRVPRLVPFFDAKAKGWPMPKLDVSAVPQANVATEPLIPAILQPPPDAPEIPASAVTELTSPPSNYASDPAASPAYHANEPIPADAYKIPASPIEAVIAEHTPGPQYRSADPNFCSIHTDAPTAYSCRDCNASFCKACPKSFGGTVKLCPACGGMCGTIGEIQQKAEKTAFRSAAMAEGFGMSDFVAAFKHPFKFKASLFIGALMYMLFTLGQAAMGMGGTMLAASGIISMMFANMLIFGILSNTVDAFAHGHLDSNFMPEYDDFSLLEDVVKPFFLWIGACVSAFGPFLLTLAVGYYLIVAAVASQTEAMQNDLERIPGTNYYSATDTYKQSQDVRSVVGNASNTAEERIDKEEAIESGETEISTLSEPDDKEIDRMMQMAQDGRKAQLESVLGKTKETREKEEQAMLQNFLSLAPPLVVIGAIFFLWGLFFFPAACAVAGYTRSFAATINPTVGLDTIKRLGGSYVKLLLMCFCLLVISGFIGGILSLVFSPFDLSGFGNLVAKSVGSFISFYFWAVFACLLGYALYKASDRLQLAS